MDFESFFKDLKSDEAWFESATMNHKPETVLEVAKDLFMSCSADNSLHRPIGDMRRYYWNKLKKITPDKVRKPFVLKEEKKDYQPTTPERRERWLKVLEWRLKKLGKLKSTPKLTSQMIEEEGGVRPKAVQPYPSTKPSEIYVRQRHLEYIKRNYDAWTKEPLPDWIEESEFNKLYDNNEGIY